uniref:Uncharacterized protein n=1 Tax=Neolamprologus brichardi TaxID=32507 RepID=A0A3Q4H3U4_NEOBR
LWLPFLLGSPSAPITFPRAKRPLLIWILSFSLSPVFPVLKMHNICELPRHLLELGFIWVAPVCLAVFPDSSKLSTSSRPSTSHSFTPHKTTKSKCN